MGNALEPEQSSWMAIHPSFAELQASAFFDQERSLQLFRRRLLAEDLESFLLSHRQFLLLAERCMGPSDCLEGLFAALSGSSDAENGSCVDVAAFCTLVAIASRGLPAEKIDFLLSCLDYEGTGFMSDGMWILSVKVSLLGLLDCLGCTLSVVRLNHTRQAFLFARSRVFAPGSCVIATCKLRYLAQKQTDDSLLLTEMPLLMKPLSLIWQRLSCKRCT